MNIIESVINARNISPIIRHISIFEIIAQLKILSVKDLYDYMKYEASEYALRKVINRLETQHFIKNTTFKGSKTKYIYLSELALRNLNYSDSYSVEPVTAYHDAVSANICLNLFKQRFLEHFTLEHESEAFNHINMNSDYRPDAIAFRDTDTKVALEIELHQKNRLEVFTKWTEYAKKRDFKQIIYFFSAQSCMDAYIRRLLEIIKIEKLNQGDANYLQENMYFVYSPSIKKIKFNLNTIEEYNFCNKKIFTTLH
jgi:hypothetical protein